MVCLPSIVFDRLICIRRIGGNPTSHLQRNRSFSLSISIQSHLIHSAKQSILLEKMEPKWLPLCTPPAPSAPNSSLPQQPHRPPPHPHPPPPPLLPTVSSSSYPVSYDADISKYAVGAVRPPSLQRLSCLLLRRSRPAAQHLSLLTAVSSPYPFSFNADVGKYAAGAVRPPSPRGLTCFLIQGSDAAVPPPTTSHPSSPTSAYAATRYASSATAPPPTTPSRQTRSTAIPFEYALLP